MYFANAFRIPVKPEWRRPVTTALGYKHKGNPLWTVCTADTDNGNTTHPSETDAFEKKVIERGGQTETVWRPKNKSEWKEVTFKVTQEAEEIDQIAQREFFQTIEEEVNYLNMAELAEWLHTPNQLEVTYPLDTKEDSSNQGSSSHNGQGEYRECEHCDGRGYQINYDDDTPCTTYCHSDCVDMAVKITHPDCNCTGTNDLDAREECSACDGEGEVLKKAFSRTFPYSKTRNQFLTEMPRQETIQAMQVVINEPNNNDDFETPSVKTVVQLFDLLENQSKEHLYDQLVSMVTPIATTEVPKRDEDGQIKVTPARTVETTTVLDMEHDLISTITDRLSVDESALSARVADV